MFALVSKLDDLFRDRPDVLVAGDVQWYPMESSPLICQAPDAMVVFGRPKGRRSAYLQWVEGDIPPQVVFEVVPPNPRHQKMIRKFRFYECYGVQEYYLYEPDKRDLAVWRRVGKSLEAVADLDEWTSPLLGIGFIVNADEVQIVQPDQRPLETYRALKEQIDRERQAREWAEQKVNRLAAQLRALGVNPET